MASSLKRIRHPYHLKKLYISWRLRLIRHAHTARRVHHQHTSYPLLALLLLGIGAVLVNSTVSTYASNTFDLHVSAIVIGVPPLTAATIDTPADNTTFTTAPITVTGTCPANSYVQLFRNNYPSGTAICASDGTYSIQTDLFEDANKLIVRDYNYADQAGPDSNVRTVFYAPPVVVPPISGSSGPTGQPAGTLSSPLVLHDDYHFQGYAVGTPASWQVSISGGSAPYSISVTWGDGQTALYTSTTADTLTLTHTYASVGPINGSYRIIVSASDAAGNHTILQVLGLVTSPTQATGTASGGTTNRSNGFTIFGAGLLENIGYLWSLYGMLCIVLLAFWLGEQRELRTIKSRFRLSRL